MYRGMKKNKKQNTVPTEMNVAQDSREGGREGELGDLRLESEQGSDPMGPHGFKRLGL